MKDKSLGYKFVQGLNHQCVWLIEDAIKNGLDKSKYVFKHITFDYGDDYDELYKVNDWLGGFRLNDNEFKKYINNNFKVIISDY